MHREDRVYEGSPDHEAAMRRIRQVVETRELRTKLEQWDDRDLQTYRNLLRERPCDLKKVALGQHGQFLKKRSSNPLCTAGLLEKNSTHEALVITGDVLRMAALPHIACIYESALHLLIGVADSVLKCRTRPKERPVGASGHAYV